MSGMSGPQHTPRLFQRRRRIAPFAYQGIVIGNVGENHPIDYFLGQIRAVRISKGERFTTDFEPDQDLPADDTTVLIYSAKSVNHNTVHDLSGHGNDGRVERF